MCIYVHMHMYVCMYVSIMRNLRILYVEEIANNENVVYLGRAGITGRRLSLIIREV